MGINTRNIDVQYLDLVHVCVYRHNFQIMAPDVQLKLHTGLLPFSTLQEANAGMHAWIKGSLAGETS